MTSPNPGEMEAHPPEARKFSQNSIRSVVRKEGLTHPLTLYPLAIGLLGGLASFLFASPVLLATALGAGVLGVASGVVNLFFRDQALTSRYLRQLRRDQDEYEQWVLKSLKDELNQCRSLEVANRQAARGVEQFDRARRKYQNVRELLQEKLNTSELAHGRFLSAAQQVYLSVLDHLKQAAAVMRSAGTIDLPYIEGRLRELASAEKNSSEKAEKQALEESLTLLKDQMSQVDRLLAANEQAMTSLEETTRRIASLNTQGRFADMDYDTAINYLQELAQGAEELSAQPRKKQEVEA